MEASRFLPFAEEAVHSLGLIKPEAIGTIALLLTLCESHHPYQVATKFRKRGAQLSAAEKKSLGLRANAFMSYEARALLSPKGMCRPMDAHGVTLLRAALTNFRARTLLAHRPQKHFSVLYSPLDANCQACSKLRKTVVDISTADPFPLPGCQMEACNLSYTLHVDFIGQLLDERSQR